MYVQFDVHYFEITIQLFIFNFCLFKLIIQKCSTGILNNMDMSVLK